MRSFSNSKLYDQNTFYEAFVRDLRHAKSRVVIKSLFITEKRMVALLPVFRRLRARNIQIVVNTKPFTEHKVDYQEQAIWVVGVMQELDIKVLMTVGHHRKLAIIDNNILWEGSLNILSQNDSCELMRRMQSEELVKEMLRFTGLKKWVR